MDGAYLDMELAGTLGPELGSNGYVAVGFSQDDRMVGLKNNFSVPMNLIAEIFLERG